MIRQPRAPIPPHTERSGHAYSSTASMGGRQLDVWSAQIGTARRTYITALERARTYEIRVGARISSPCELEPSAYL